MCMSTFGRDRNNKGNSKWNVAAHTEWVEHAQLWCHNTVYVGEVGLTSMLWHWQTHTRAPRTLSERDGRHKISRYFLYFVYLSPLFACCNNKKHFGLSLVKNAWNQEQCNGSTGQLENLIPPPCPTFIVFHSNATCRGGNNGHSCHMKKHRPYATQGKKQYSIVLAGEILKHEHTAYEQMNPQRMWRKCCSSAQSRARAEIGCQTAVYYETGTINLLVAAGSLLLQLCTTRATWEREKKKKGKQSTIHFKDTILSTAITSKAQTNGSNKTAHY